MIEWFDVLLAEGEAGIDRLVAKRTQESVQLDFKEKADASHGDFNDGDRRTLAKALSAFSNSAGGLLIFGVEARKEAGDPADCAREAKPITNIELFRSQATGLVGQLLQPKHDGIRIGAILSQHSPGAGYLVLAVERSERRPHRSEASGHKQYFKRAGDNFFEMEHYDIEDAFKRTMVPDLSIRWVVEDQMLDGANVATCMIAIQIENRSSITAKYPYLDMASLFGGAPHYHHQTDFQARHEQGWSCFSGGADIVINPGTSRTVTVIDAKLKRSAIGFYTAGGLPQGPFLKFDFRLGCENALSKTGSFVLRVEQLTKA